MKTVEKLKGWRTIIIAVILSIPPVVVAADEIIMEEGQSVLDRIPPEWMIYYTMLVLFSKIYLRVITTTPIGVKE